MPPQFRQFNALQSINAFQAGRQARDQRRQQNALMEAGQLLSEGDTQGAQNALFRSGSVNEGLRLQQIQQQLRTSGQRKAPEGFTFNDPANPAAGVTPIPGFIEGKSTLARAARPQVNVNTNLPPIETEEQKAQGKFFGEQFKTVQDAGGNARTNLNKINRFKQLLAKTPTGTLQQSLLPIRQALVSSGLATKAEADAVADLEGLRSLGVDFALDSVQKTKGAISNAEMALFIQAAANIGNTPEGNRIILNAQEKIANRQLEIADLQRTYRRGEPIEINGQTFQAPRKGTVDGFQNVVDAFQTANPIFTPEETQAMSQGAPQTTAQGQQPVSVTTAAEAEALPPGTPFRTPDGRVLIRN